MKAVRLVVVAVMLGACTTGTSVQDLSVGDCFDDPDEELISSLPLVDCAEPHDNEIYASVQHPGTAFPGLEALTQFGLEECLAEFEPAIGESYAASSLDYLFFFPSEESWDNGDREYLCYAYEANLDKLTGSVRG